MNPYYERLDPSRSEIRLLTLLPNDDSDAEIQCSLQVVSLDDTTEFEALSYVWGKTVCSKPIFVRGEPLHVTTNLDRALRHLRLPQSRRVLWVDAICIDQCYPEEKNTQIPLMARLYRSAKSVLAWLEVPNEAMEAAIRWAHEYISETTTAGSASSSSPLSGSATQVDAVEKGHSEELEYIARLGQVLDGFGQLKDSEYWKRMWTLQEYRLPEVEPVCICGQYSFSATQLLDRAEVPLIRAFLNLVKRDPEGWPRSSSLSRNIARLRQLTRASLSNKELETFKGSAAYRPLLFSLKVGNEIIERLLAHLEVDVIVESLHRSEEVTANLLSEVRALGSNLELPTAGSKPYIQREGLAMDSAMRLTAKAAAMASLESIYPSFTFSNFRHCMGDTSIATVMLLSDSLDRQCSAMQDKVYALYGMAPEKIQQLYPPDYSKHPGQVYQETAAYIFEHEHEGVYRMLLSYNFRNLEAPSMFSSYPSWVPDFTDVSTRIGPLLNADRVTQRLIGWARNNPPLLLDDGQTLASFAVSLGAAEIILEFEDTFSKVIPPVVAMLNGDHLPKYNCGPMPHMLPGRENRCYVEAFTRLYAGQAVGGQGITVHRLKASLMELKHNPSSAPSNEALSCMVQLMGQKLVVTDHGYLGLCPPHTKNGDLVAIWPSLRGPVVLRQYSEPETSIHIHWKLVGSAHFQELVDGEWLNDKYVDEILEQKPLLLFIR
ncbi:HET domain protein [Apiospora hydei]|uniref:HET domain protein n=1 Tax=Apiospora hydei TaxID=1337664 RepID=A0ABR1UQA9_9PEZI